MPPIPTRFLENWIEANVPASEELVAIRAKVCEYSANVLGHDHWVSREYHDVICEFGGEAWRDYFEESLQNGQTRNRAFIALARLAGEDRDQFLRKHAAGFAGPPPHLQSQAISMLAHELAGTQDAELTQLLTKLFHESGKDSDLRIRQMFLIGSTETAGQLLTELRASRPQPYQQDITKLLEDLSSFRFARYLTVADVNGRIMPADPTEHLPHEAFLDPKEQVRTTLETAGLRVGVDMVMDLSDQRQCFPKWPMVNLTWTFFTSTNKPSSCISGTRVEFFDTPFPTRRSTSTRWSNQRSPTPC